MTPEPTNFCNKHELISKLWNWRIPWYPLSRLLSTSSGYYALSTHTQMHWCLLFNCNTLFHRAFASFWNVFRWKSAHIVVRLYQRKRNQMVRYLTADILLPREGGAEGSQYLDQNMDITAKHTRQNMIIFIWIFFKIMI